MTSAATGSTVPNWRKVFQLCYYSDSDGKYTAVKQAIEKGFDVNTKVMHYFIFWKFWNFHIFWNFVINLLAKFIF